MIQLDHNDYNVPGILLSVSFDGRSIKHMVSGRSDLENKIPMNSEGLLRCGLITRMFTSAILLQLVDENAFDLDAPLDAIAHQHQQDRGVLKIMVSQYPFLKPVTVRELLSNTTGLPSFNKTTTFEQIFIKKPRKIWQVENYLDAISGVDVRYQRGYQPSVRGYFSDSDTNFIVAGLVIEAVSGVPTSEAMRDLFREFKLKNTSYLSYGKLDNNIIPHMLHGYLPVSHPYAMAFRRQPVLTYNNNKELRVYDVTTSYTVSGMGNAAMVSNTSDLIHWMQQLVNCKVVINNYKQMFEVVPTPSFSTTSTDYYCLGFYKTIFKDYGEIIWSAGNSLGYGVLLAHAIDKNITFALMVNVSRTFMSLHNEQLVSHILQDLLS